MPWPSNRSNPIIIRGKTPSPDRRAPLIPHFHPSGKRHCIRHCMPLLYAKLKIIVHGAPYLPSGSKRKIFAFKTYPHILAA
jgi:hypothetical protein